MKVADFGLARSVACNDDDGQPVLTEYVATRWYRAPGKKGEKKEKKLQKNKFIFY